MQLAAYLQTMHDVPWREDDAKADEIFYLFGEHGAELEPLLQQYQLPRYASTLFSVEPDGSMGPAQPALSFGVAADGSGVPFHFHNDGFSEVMHGAKRWLLYPSAPPQFDPDQTSVRWLRDVYPRLSEREAPMECVIEPGDLLYFPKDWYHAIVNLGTTVFMSTFL